jgi:hypothetical protein
MNGKWQSQAGGAWTAISQAPYLKALVLLAKGDCWNGGGLFIDATTYWLNDGYGHTVLADSPKLRRTINYIPTGGYGNECLSVYYPRLQRDGWKYIEEKNLIKWKTIYTFEKELSHGWILRKIAHAEVDHPRGKGCYWDEHCLYQSNTDTTIACPDWEWADLDRRRLVWATNGRLFTGYLDNQGIHDQRMLHDFNLMQFEAITAPY